MINSKIFLRECVLVSTLGPFTTARGDIEDAIVPLLEIRPLAAFRGLAS